MRTFVRVSLLAAALLIAAPFVLIALYGFLTPASTLMISRWINERPVTRDWVGLEDISPHVARAVIVSEDARFCLHYGIDVRQLKIVLDDLRAGKSVRGASTITMQTVKNLVLWPDQSYTRKAIEIVLAAWMDLILSKDRILEIYLNVAQWGPGIFGVEAAAQHHFGKPAAALSRSEAMRLAAVLPSPGTRDPRRPGSRHRAHVERIDRELGRSQWVFSCLPAAIDPQTPA